jgi:hypothetical protein
MANATDSTPATTARRRGFIFWLVALLLVSAVLITLYTLFMLSWSYAEGERAGVLQKFSKRGWICKTYEGELAMYVVGGIAPQIWNFSVRDEAVATRLHGSVGSQVRLHYTEHPGLPTNCFAETRYFVEDFSVVDSPGVIAPSSSLTVAPGTPGPGVPDTQGAPQPQDSPDR